jgi:exodeoxyribonuclease III
VLSKFPIVHYRNHDVSIVGPEKRGLLHCALRLPARPVDVHVICAHLGLSEAHRLQQLELLCHIVRDEVPADAPLVVAGDFNVCPTDLDVYDPSAFVGATHVTPPERERFQALLDSGTVDAFRQLHPEEPGFTWWDYRQGHFHRKMGLRIDAFLLSHPLAADLIECGIDRSFRTGTRPSDPAPLLCTVAR